MGELSREVRANKVEVAAVRELTKAVDRDVSEMHGFRRATIASFNALRADMVDMRQDIGDMRQDIDDMRQDIGDMCQDINGIRRDMVDGFRRVDERFAQVDNGFAEMRAKFDITAAGQQRIVELIRQAIYTQGGTAPARCRWASWSAARRSARFAASRSGTAVMPTCRAQGRRPGGAAPA